MALTVGVFLLLFGAGLWAFTRMGHRFAMVERGVGLVKKKRRIAFSVFFFNDTATTEIYTLSLHDALPIFCKKDKRYFAGLCGRERPADGEKGGGNSGRGVSPFTDCRPAGVR